MDEKFMEEAGKNCNVTLKTIVFPYSAGHCLLGERNMGVLFVRYSILQLGLRWYVLFCGHGQSLAICWDIYVRHGTSHWDLIVSNSPACRVIIKDASVTEPKFK